MAAFLCPILGITIDKIGRRALFITLSSVAVAIACFFSAMLPNYDSPNYIVLVPLILVGIAYSIYASALWSSIPYLVLPRTLGTAFGIVTSIQGAGLTVCPLVSGVIMGKNGTNYTPEYIWLGSLATIGIGFNIWLYIDDIKYRNSVLDKVPKAMADLMSSPVAANRRTLDKGPEGFNEFNNTTGDVLGVPIGVEVYEFDKSARDTLKRSMAK
jgi:MFS family permease